jgi:hypothetical protein
MGAPMQPKAARAYSTSNPVMMLGSFSSRKVAGLSAALTPIFSVRPARPGYLLAMARGSHVASSAIDTPMKATQQNQNAVFAATTNSNVHGQPSFPDPGASCVLDDAQNPLHPALIGTLHL